MMRRYLDRGRAGPTNCMSTAAACVVQSGNVELLKRVLSESSVDVNWVGEGSDKAMFSRFIIPVLDLILKCKRGTPSAFMAFFVFAGPRGAAPLHFASYNGNLGAVEVLLEHNADVHSTKHAYRMTPLHLAAMNGHEAVVDALLKAGARTDAKALGGKTPRDWAEQRGTRRSRSGYSSPRRVKSGSGSEVTRRVSVYVAGMSVSSLVRSRREHQTERNAPSVALSRARWPPPPSPARAPPPPSPLSTRTSYHPPPTVASWSPALSTRATCVRAPNPSATASSTSLCTSNCHAPRCFHTAVRTSSTTSTRFPIDTEPSKTACQFQRADLQHR